MAPLSISLFGALQIARDEQPLTGFESLKVRALLAYLAVEADRPHTRGALADLLWPELPHTSARANLRQALANLRAVLHDQAADAPVLLVTRESIQFNRASEHWLDVAVFTGHLSACAAHPHQQSTPVNHTERLTQAAALYCGAFLDQLSLGDSAPFEEWATLRRASFHQQMLDILVRLSALAEQRGDNEAARGFARRQIALEPWREEAHQQLMRLLWRSGQRSAALAQYEACRHILAAELGVEPATETSALYEQMRGGSPAVVKGAAPLHNLAAQKRLTPFIGRTEELAWITGQLEQRHTRLLTLVGPGGVGKTRLAVQAAAALHGTFAHGIWFVNLAPLQAPELVASAIAQSLGLRESGDRTLSESLKSFLYAQQLLLILDNFEHVAAAAPLVAELLTEAPGLYVLVTSRRPLHLSAEYEFAVPPLAPPARAGPQDSDQISRSDAVQLFVERARAVRPGFSVTHASAASVAELCRRLDGLPLAIELAAARVKLFPPVALLTRLDQRLALLTGGARDLAPRQRTLRSTIDWSHSLLSAGEQILFARLAVFVGGCTLEAAEAICDTGSKLPFTIVDGVSALLDQSMLGQELGIAGEIRLTMLETLCEYALERLTASGEVALLRHRHALYYLARAEAAEPLFRSTDWSLWRARLMADHDNLRAALAWSQASGEHELGLRLVGALRPFWELAGHFGEGRRWADELLAQGAQELTAPARARVYARALLTAGVLAEEQSAYSQADKLLDQSAVLFRASGDIRVLADALVKRAPVVGDLGALSQARLLIGEAITHYRTLGEQWDLTEALSILGDIAKRQGEYAQARAASAEALRLSRAIGHTNGVTRGLLTAGYQACTWSELPTAGVCFAEALGLLRANDEPWSSSYALVGLGWVAW